MVHGYDSSDWEQSEPPPWKHVVSDYKLSSPPTRFNEYADLYSVPRRFDLASLLVVTTAYALLFTGMTVLDFPFATFAYFAFLLAVVAIAQSIFAERYNPRTVSMVAGTAYYLFWSFIWLATVRRTPMGVGCMTFSTVVFGPIQGYLSGTLVAGTFLVADYLRKFLGLINLHRENSESQTEINSPWDE